MQEFKPHKPQRQFFEALGQGFKFFVLLWPRQTGKTEASKEVIFDAALNLNGTVVYMAPELTQAKQLAWEPLLEKFTEAGVLDHSDKNEHSMKIKNIHGGITKVFFFGWNGGRVDSLRGKTVDFIIVDEVDQCREFIKGLKEVLIPTLTTTGGKAVFISTPKNFGNMWWLKKQSEKFPERYYFSKASWRDNPFADVEPIENERKEAEDNGSMNSYLQEYEAEFVMASGAIFDGYDPEKHLIKDDVAEIESLFKTKIVGLDFAYGNNGTTAILFGGFTKENHLIITREVYTNIISPKLIAEEIKKYDPEAVYADPADPWRINELKDWGVPIIDFKKPGGFIISGLERLGMMFSNDMLYIHESCENLNVEIGSAEWKEVKDGVMSKPKPDERVPDHARDALAYIVMNAPEYYYYINAKEERNYFLKNKNKQIIQ